MGLESTVLSLIYAKPAILRLGMIARHQIEAVVGPLDGAGEDTGEVRPIRLRACIRGITVRERHC